MGGQITQFFRGFCFSICMQHSGNIETDDS